MGINSVSFGLKFRHFSFRLKCQGPRLSIVPRLRTPAIIRKEKLAYSAFSVKG